jgi:NADPH2 dehydrogenase
MFWRSQVSISNLQIRNRIVFPPINCNWSDLQGNVTSRILSFYKHISNGGCGMVVVSGTSISQAGKAVNRSLCLSKESHLRGFARLADKIKKNGCFASIQLMHVGGQGNPDFTGSEPVSPSGIKCRATGFDSRALSVSEIDKVRSEFINSAILASKAGFNAIELHLAHGYLLHEFLSRHTNKRRDKYGGCLENRVRLILEIISGIKERAPGLIVGVRISGEDFVEDGINEKVNREILPLLQDAGVAYYSVTAGIYETSKIKHEAMSKGEFFNYARDIKKMVDKPVIGVGKILDLGQAENHLKNKDCDMVAIGRGLIADSMMLRKDLNKQSFNRCTECDQCSFLRFGRKELYCPVMNN